MVTSVREPVLTDRLVLTPVSRADLEDLTVLGRDPAVSFWTGPWDVEPWLADMITRWDRDGVGKWVARDRDAGVLVGRGGFTRMELEGVQVLELGWAIRDHLTGRGLATELGRAALAWADDHHRDLPVVAFTEVHNRASRAVMERLGMRCSGTITRPGLVQGRSGVQPEAPFALYRIGSAASSA